MNDFRRVLIIPLFVFVISNSATAGNFTCAPTPEDSLGPFFKPDAPIRSKVGEGHVLSGTVKSATDCAPIPRARIELWLAAADGGYDDEHRATLLADESGFYQFESNAPPKYTFRPPHIHLRVTAEGYKTLVTQYYTKPGRSVGNLPLVLVPR